MKKKLFIILGILVLSINLLLSYSFKENKKENKEISKALEILSKPEGVQAYTLNGEKTNIEFNDLINNYVLDKITCKNGTTATYNKATNEVSLSNIHMPDYCTMNFRYTIYGKLLADNPTIKTRTDFSTTYTETNTGTLFKSTESIVGSTAKDVYYVAGDAKNNWVKFGGFYWRIIRTNHDKSIRLLYSGTSPDTTEGYIGTSAFNTEYNSPKYVGYMYGNSDTTLDEARTNTNDSTIKTFIDNWYSNNLNSYTKYISAEAVYCNDREEGNGTYSTNSSFFYAPYTRLYVNNVPSYNCTNNKDVFSGSNTEAKLTYPIGLMTGDEIAFAGGKGGTSLPKPYVWYYVNGAGLNITGNVWWWLLSPDGWYNSDRAGVFRADGSDDPGYLYGSDVNDKGGVRPVISLKGNLIWKSGDGSSTNPYEVEDLPATLYEKLLADNSTIKTRSDFSTTYTETNTGTLFKSTESIAGSTAETVYYFAGDAKNNWVKFGDFYWRIIRTNHDGSVRLLYSGTSPDTSDVSIGESPFTLDISDIKYTGYMYGTSGTLDNNRTNENNSTIKDKVDAWYSENLIKYAKYISKNAVYCSDRNQTSIYGFTANGAFMKLAYSKNPSYDCTDIRDSFSANNLEAKLIYPIALMTADELSYAGGVYRISGENIWYNCISNSCINIGFWSMSGWSLYNSEARSLYAEGTYLNDNIGMASTLNVRPVISIKGDAIWSKGDGTSSSPYEIVYN